MSSTAYFPAALVIIDMAAETHTSYSRASVSTAAGGNSAGCASVAGLSAVWAAHTKLEMLSRSRNQGESPGVGIVRVEALWNPELILDHGVILRKQTEVIVLVCRVRLKMHARWALKTCLGTTQYASKRQFQSPTRHLQNHNYTIFKTAT